MEKLNCRTNWAAIVFLIECASVFAQRLWAFTHRQIQIQIHIHMVGGSFEPGHFAYQLHWIYPGQERPSPLSPSPPQSMAAGNDGIGSHFHFSTSCPPICRWFHNSPHGKFSWSPFKGLNKLFGTCKHMCFKGEQVKFIAIFLLVKN